MRCSKPLVMNGSAFGCGQCTPCRINRRRIWAHRIMLEAAQYKDNCFITLSYSDEHLPGDQSVTPRQLSAFMKRFRDRIKPLKVRYFGVGEYGDATFRPHYHAALFGFPRCRKGLSRFNSEGHCCSTCDVISLSWGMGNIFVGDLTIQSASYIAGYVTKKMTGEFDPRLEGRRPEFARMSLRPGIGVGMMDEVASALLTHRLDERMIDVPNTLRHGAKEMPLGRYLRQKLRERIGRDKKEPPEAAKARKEEMQVLRDRAFNNSQSLSSVVAEEYKGKVANIEARNKIFRQKRSI